MIANIKCIGVIIDYIDAGRLRIYFYLLILAF